MKKLFFALVTGACLYSPLTQSFETAVRGFIALDALNYEKVKNNQGSAIIGIGVLDLKIFAEQDGMAAALKLDLDGKLEKQNNIFEEAYATYKGLPKWRFSLGKGVVRFQNLHWGAIVNSYQDGGTVIQSDNSYRKVSRKAFIAASYGGRSEGFIDQFTVWGDSTELDLTQEGKISYLSSGTATSKQITGLKTRDVTAFDTKKQLGLANKLEFFVSDNLKLTSGQLYYKNKKHDRASYALDVGVSYESSTMEVWVDSLYGHTSKLPYEPYATKSKDELFLQVGMEYYLNEKWSLVENIEGLKIKDRQHTYTTFVEDGVTYTPRSELLEKSGALIESFTYKIESAVKYKLTAAAQLTLGALYEKKTAKKDGVENLTFIRDVPNANKDAYKVAATVSFWF